MRPDSTLRQPLDHEFYVDAGTRFAYAAYHLNLAPTIYCGLKRLVFKARFMILILYIGNMPAGQNHSNFALNTRLSSPRYDTWCKIQV